MGQLSPEYYSLIQQVGLIIAQNFGPSIGLQDPGRMMQAVHQGILAGGGVAGAPGVGYESTAAAMQLVNILQDFARNRATGVNNTFQTGGLNEGTLAGMAAQIMAERGGVRTGDFTTMILPHAPDRGLNALANAFNNGVSRDTQEAQQAVNIMRTVWARNDAMRTYSGTEGGKALEAAEKHYRDLLNAKKAGEAVSDADLSTAYNDMLRQQAVREGYVTNQLRGKTLGEFRDPALGDKTWGGFTITEGMLRAAAMPQIQLQMPTNQFKNDMEDALRAASANVAALAEILDTEDFAEIQRQVRALGMGSLTSKSNADSVAKRIKDIKAEAVVTGRSVQEVVAEQAEIVDVLGQVYGGKDKVNPNGIAYYQRVKSQAEMNERLGLGGRTSAEAQADAITSIAASNEYMKNAAVLETIIRENGDAMDPADRAEAEALLEKIKSGKLSYSELMSANSEAGQLARKLDYRAIDPKFQQYAVATTHMDLVTPVDRAAALANADTYASRMIHTSRKQYDRAVQSGLIKSEKDLKRLNRDWVMATGGDAALQNEIIDLVRSGSDKDKEAFLNRMRASGASKDEIDATRRILRRASGEEQANVLKWVTSGLTMHGSEANLQSWRDRGNREAAEREESLRKIRENDPGVKMNSGASFLEGLLNGDASGLSASSILGNYIGQKYMRSDDEGNRLIDTEKLAKSIDSEGILRLGRLNDKGNLEGIDYEDKAVQKFFGAKNEKDLRRLLKDPGAALKMLEAKQRSGWGLYNSDDGLFAADPSKIGKQFDELQRMAKDNPDLAVADIGSKEGGDATARGTTRSDVATSTEKISTGIESLIGKADTIVSSLSAIAGCVDGDGHLKVKLSLTS